MLKPIEHYIFKLTSFGGLAYLKSNKFIFIIGSVQKQLGIRSGNRFSFWPDLDPDSMNIRVEWLLKKKLGNRQSAKLCKDPNSKSSHFDSYPKMGKSNFCVNIL